MKALLRQSLITGTQVTPETSPRLAAALEAVAYAKTLLAEGFLSPSEFELAVDAALEWLP